AEHEAHVRAEKRASREKRYNEELLRQQRDDMRRIANEERLRIESAERARSRQAREEAEIAERARRQQQQQDIEAFQRAEHIINLREERDRLARLRVRRQPRYPVTVHNGLNDFEQRGDDFLDSALNAAVRADNMMRFERTAPRMHQRPQAEGLRRRDTVHERPYIGLRRRYERRQGGFG
ncbi:MAG: hypothetical protein Q9164_004302, partial [Protoblastenia rupestris]